jgi:hypothetical protein
MCATATDFRRRAKAEIIRWLCTCAGGHNNTLNNSKENSTGGDEDLASDEGSTNGTSVITLSMEPILVNGGTR